MESVAKVFEKYNVQVFRPKTVIENYNQIFSRDIGFVIEDKFIRGQYIFQIEIKKFWQ